jgi:Rod binding domain-containing protein
MNGIAPPASIAASLATASPAAKPQVDPRARAREQAVEFEAVFLNNMFTQMFTGTDGDGPFGGGGKAGVWRSFLTDEYAKSFAKAGGIGIADHVYRSLLAQQEVAGAR